MTKEEFKERWNSDNNGGGITYDDIALCAKEWGICSNPRTADINQIEDRVLEAAGCKKWKTLFETASDLLKAAEIPSENIPVCDGWEGMMYKFTSANDAVRAVNALSMLLVHEDSYPYLRIELENRPDSHTVTVIEGDEEWDYEDEEED